jgi:hypothetical protein
LAYVAWVLIRGPIAGEYPYPTLDVNALGYSQVATNLAILLVAFVILSALMILIDRAVAAFGGTR